MFIDHLRELADRHPNHEALVSSDRRVTYGELMSVVDAKARTLRNELIDNGGVVGLSIRDDIEHMIACLSLMAAGRRLITLATFNPLEARQALATAAGIETVLGDDASSPLPGIPQMRWSGIEGAQPGSAMVPRVGSVLMRTSGSTGEGKLFEFDETQLAVQIRDVAQYAGLRYFRLASVEHHIAQRQRLLCLYSGGTNVFRTPEEPDPAKTRMALGFDIIELSLMHAEDLLRRDDRSAFSGVIIRMTGSPVSYRMRQQIQERVSHELYVRYGASECGTVSIAGPTEHDADEVAGLLSPGVEVEVLDANGMPVPQGERGLLRIRAPGMAKGYLNAGETAKRFVDGWFLPGDVGWFRADGQLIVAGRSDDMMMLNGMNIFPKEIEQILELHPAVRAAAALSLDSPVHGQIPVAAVQLEAGADIAVSDLQTYAREQLGLRAPRRIIIVETLPRASDGKLHRRSLLSAFRPER